MIECDEIYDKHRDIYPIELIKTGCSMVKNTSRLGPEKGFYRYDVRRAMILYTFEEIDGKFLPLNREYKPIGLMFYKGYVKYEDFPFLLIPKERINFEEMPKKNYMFDDGSFPRGPDGKRYINAIERVFSFKIHFKEHY